MLDHARRHLGAKFLDAHSRANFVLQREAPLRRIHDAHCLRMVDPLRHCRQRHHQLVHHEPRVHARPHQRHAPILRRGIEFRRQFRIGPEGVGKLFARRNHTRFRLETFQQLIHHSRQRRGSRMDHHVRRFLQHFFNIGGNLHAPGRICRASHLAKIPPRFGRVYVNGPHDFYSLLLAQQFHDGGADRPDPILDGADFLLHVSLRAHSAVRTLAAAVCGKKVLYDKGNPRAGQRKTRLPAERCGLAARSRCRDNVAGRPERLRKPP